MRDAPSVAEAERRRQGIVTRYQRDFPAANHRPPQYVYKYNSQGRSYDFQCESRLDSSDHRKH